MATLVLSSVGGAIGNAIAPGFGEVLGRAAGAVAGGAIDQALFAPSEKPAAPPNLSDLHVQASTEGAAINRIYGTARVAGQIIWATKYRAHARSQGGSGKGGGRRQSPQETYYTISFAVALCEGEIGGVGRIWADGEPLEASAVSYRLHKGGQDQNPDSVIEAEEGAGQAPAYRGTAYIVFEDMDVSPYGNRIPQLSFEVSRPLSDTFRRVKAVTVIPGSTEFGYHSKTIWRNAGYGETISENAHNAEGVADWSVAINQLQDQCENCESVALVVSWFGSDLRCGVCEIKPGVEIRDKATGPELWNVAGLQRHNAHLVSRHDGRPAYGGTPSDLSVIAAIKDLKRRGLKILFYPFILMDIPAGNSLPNPYGGASQPAHPWRGRITCHPAPGETGSPDKSQAVQNQINHFFGSASNSHFRIENGAVVYRGSAEWGLRRMILHCAHLCKAAGGVDAFLIGSELKSLTSLRGSADAYPAVQAMRSLAQQAKAALPSAKISYAADWSEYAGHRPSDGTGDVFFHLDPLWASASVDFVGIDYYMPLADWRDGDSHKDAAAAKTIHDPNYLRRNIAAAEFYDWHYASQSDRETQTRTPIRDTAHNEHWVFRAKDIASWWKERHHNRPRGVRASRSTAWRPGMKPVWLTEMGCPAIDKGANQPNVFSDQKSSESALPHFSSGAPDDAMQRAYLEAILSAFDPSDPAHRENVNPKIAATNKRMLHPDNIYVWTWDARPYPHFPQNLDVWADGVNWRRGHWITGRSATSSLAEAVAHIFRQSGVANANTASLSGILQGFVLDRVMSARDAMEALMRIFFFDAVEKDGIISCHHRGEKPLRAIDAERIAVSSSQTDAPAFQIARRQETDLPLSAKLIYIDPQSDYRQAVAEARRLTTPSRYTAVARMPIVSDQGQMLSAARRWLFETWAARERVSFRLPPSQMDLEPGDIIRLNLKDRRMTLRIAEIRDAGAIELEALSYETALAKPAANGEAAEARQYAPAQAALYAPPIVHLLDLPLLRGNENADAPFVAIASEPWPGVMTVHQSSSEDHGFSPNIGVSRPATIGVGETGLAAGKPYRWNRGASFRVRLASGELASRPESDVLNGENAAALRHADGAWEIVQFQKARLVSANLYEISNLLRGQRGTENLAAKSLPRGAAFVLLSRDLPQAALSPSDRGRQLFYRIAPSRKPPQDPSAAALAFTFQSAAQKPLPPVHAKASRLPNGGVRVQWLRQSRIRSDDWTVPDIPLGEESERYEVEILKDGAPVRLLRSAAPETLYSAAHQRADFGGTSPTSLALRIFQMSAAIGRGAPLEATLSL